jgi:hypothetical protein
MSRVSVDARLVVARCEAAGALDALRDAVVRGRGALAAVEDLKGQQRRGVQEQARAAQRG